MSVPAKLGELLAKSTLEELPGRLNTDDACEGAKFHSPNPLILVSVSIVDPIWPGLLTDLGPRVLLCRTCADNLRVYQHLLGKHNGQLDWPVRREFGNLIRAIGDRGWQHYLGELEESRVG